MRDLTSTDSVHHSERSARGVIPDWSLAKIHVFMDLTLMQVCGPQGCELRVKVPWTEQRMFGRLDRGTEGTDTIVVFVRSGRMAVR